MDKKKMRKKIAWKLANSPASLLPFTGGATGLIIAAVVHSGLIAFLSLTLVLGSIGNFFTKLLNGNSDVAREVLKEIEEEETAERKNKLGNLERRLSLDGDPKTELLLRALITLTDKFREQLNNKNWSMRLNTQSTFDILANVEELFQGCIKSLEKSLEIWYVADKIEIEQAKIPILERRNEIIKRVEASVEKLSHIYAEIQRIVIEEKSDDDLERIRRELDNSLEVARRVEKKLSAFNHSTNHQMEE